MGKREEAGKLINDIISFLENERDLFGDFSANVTFEHHKNETMIASKHSNRQDDTKNISKKTEQFTFEGDWESDLKKCNSLEDLYRLCEKTNRLKTDLDGTNLVFGVGNPEADLMLIGEAPGEQEDKLKEPFVGAAGKLLNKILAAIDFNREDIYIANILKHRPPNNRDPLPEERQKSLPFLLKQIELIDPKLILCLGKVAAQTLLETDQTLTGMRGKFHKFKGKYDLLVTFHPAALLYHPKWKKPTWEDVQKLRKRYDEMGCKP